MKNETMFKSNTNTTSLSVEVIAPRRSVSKRGYTSWQYFTIQLPDGKPHNIRIYNKLSNKEGDLDYLYRLPWGLALVKYITYRDNKNERAAAVALDAVLTNSTVDNLAVHIASTYKTVYGFDEFELVNRTISEEEITEMLRQELREFTEKLLISDIPFDYYDTSYVEKLYTRKAAMALKIEARKFVFEKAKPFYKNLTFGNLKDYVSIRIASEYTASLKNDSMETLLSYCRQSRAKATRAFSSKTIRNIRLAFGYDYAEDEKIANEDTLARRRARNPYYGLPENVQYFYKTTEMNKVTNDEIILFTTDVQKELSLTNDEINVLLSWLILCKKNCTQKVVLPELPESMIIRYERGREGGMSCTRKPETIFYRFRADVAHSNAAKNYPIIQRFVGRLSGRKAA